MFTSDGIRVWIRASLLEIWESGYELGISVEVPALRIIMNWLEKTKPWVSNMKDMHILRAVEENTELKTAIEWSRMVLGEHYLGEVIGKAAMRV